jgi:D-lactate dehydrogenase
LFGRRLPHAARGDLPRTSIRNAHVVYFPSCVSRVVGPHDGAGEASVVELLARVAERAGAPVWIPDDVPGTCCGMPFSSKGFRAAHEIAVNRAVERMWRWSNEGELPVVLDTSPCTVTLKQARTELRPMNRVRFDSLTILDGIELAERLLANGLKPVRRKGSVVLHPVCSVHKMELVDRLDAVARACADEVLVPIDAGCCGFAGDRGLTHPELTAAAMRVEASEVQTGEHDGYYSSSRTCEIGLSRATGRSYRSLWSLLDDVTR